MPRALRSASVEDLTALAGIMVSIRVRGVIVTEVAEGGPAFGKGLEVGNIIKRFGQRPVGMRPISPIPSPRRWRPAVPVSCCWSRATAVTLYTDRFRQGVGSGEPRETRKAG